MPADTCAEASCRDRLPESKLGSMLDPAFPVALRSSAELVIIMLPERGKRLLARGGLSEAD